MSRKPTRGSGFRFEGPQSGTRRRMIELARRGDYAGAALKLRTLSGNVGAAPKLIVDDCSELKAPQRTELLAALKKLTASSAAIATAPATA